MLDGRVIGVNAIPLGRFAHFADSRIFPSFVGPGVTFLGYAVIAVLALPFVRFFVTETKGRGLERIVADLQDRSVAT
jgi:hypothetical protein